MIFDLIDLAFEIFVAFCLYQLAILPMLKEKEEKMTRLSNFYDEQIKKLEKEKDYKKIDLDELNNKF